MRILGRAWRMGMQQEGAAMNEESREICLALSLCVLILWFVHISVLINIRDSLKIIEKQNRDEHLHEAAKETE